MPSPICTVNGASTINGVNVTQSSTVTIQLADLTGVNSWSITCVGTDEKQDPGTITSSLSINATTKTATYTAPSETTGSKLIFKSVINNGQDVNGIVNQTYTTTFCVCCLGPNGVRVLATNETIESNLAHGWIADWNTGIRNATFNALDSVVLVNDADYTVTATNVNVTVLYLTLSANRNLTLPASPGGGQRITVKDVSGALASFNIIVNGNGSNIDGSSTYTMTNAHDGPKAALTVINGSGWNIV